MADPEKLVSFSYEGGMLRAMFDPPLSQGDIGNIAFMETKYAGPSENEDDSSEVPYIELRGMNVETKEKAMRMAHDVLTDVKPLGYTLSTSMVERPA